MKILDIEQIKKAVQLAELAGTVVILKSEEINFILSKVEDLESRLAAANVRGREAAMLAVEFQHALERVAHWPWTPEDRPYLWEIEEYVKGILEAQHTGAEAG